MWTLDFAEDFSGLSGSQIYALEKKNILHPKKQHGCKQYSFQDVLILRLIRILRNEGIRINSITYAFDYLRDWDPEKPLSSYVLVHDKRDVYALIDLNTVNATKDGQLILKGAKQFISVGSHLEETRKGMFAFENELLKRQKSRVKFISVDVSKWAV